MTTDLSHLAFFLPSLAGGGAERVIFDIARAASRQVEQVDLVLVKRTGAYCDEDPGAVNIVDLNSSRSLRSVPSLAQYLRNKRPQAIISAMPHTNIAAILALGLSRSPSRIVISERSMMSRHKNPEIRVAMMLRAMRLLYSRADRAIAISEQVRDAMVKGTSFPPERAVVVHNPVDLERIHNLCRQPPSHPWLSKKTTPVIVTAGRLVDEKDQGTLIRAMKKLSHSQARLIIFGEGRLRAKLEATRAELDLQDRVDLPGFVPNPYAEFSAADILALPSKSEGFANVVTEALACGTPVVATRATGGIADSLEDGKAVRLVGIGDDSAMAAAMDACISAPPARAVMQSIAAGFTLEHAWKGYRDVILASLSERGS